MEEEATLGRPMPLEEVSKVWDGVSPENRRLFLGNLLRGISADVRRMDDGRPISLADFGDLVSLEMVKMPETIKECIFRAYDPDKRIFVSRVEHDWV